MQTQFTSSSGPTPTATIAVTISAFYPIGAIYPISAQLALTSGNSKAFNYANGKLTITVPVGTEVQINYQLNDPRFVLLGIAFNPNGPGAGRQEFPEVILNRTTNGSSMSVIDESLASFQGVDYTYVILVQEVATGCIGIIDPDIENDPI